MKRLFYILKYAKYNISYKEYKLLFANGNDEIGDSAMYLSKKLNIKVLTKNEVEKIYFIFKLNLLKVYHYSNFKFKDDDINTLINFLMTETKGKITIFEAIEFHNYTIQMIPKKFQLFSKFIYNNNSNWIKVKLPFNTKESAYLVNSEKEIKTKFDTLFKNSHLKLNINLSNTEFDNSENKVYYKYEVIDKHKNIWGKVFFYEYSKSFLN
ncbi:hypothetical protein [Epilithonimonas hominis]|uniref:hypothetical protein n=1 Tax=Epilithonimonas hominis TaxID=420404 RepID=UPI0028AFC52A|nr:hypothetical protein [Epilithonimonas hominis]